MEPLNIALLVGSCAISFGIGRLILHWRKKRRAEAAKLARAVQPITVYNDAHGGVIKKKSKRKRLEREFVKNRAR